MAQVLPICYLQVNHLAGSSVSGVGDAGLLLRRVLDCAPLRRLASVAPDLPQTCRIIGSLPGSRVGYPISALSFAGLVTSISMLVFFLLVTTVSSPLLSALLLVVIAVLRILKRTTLYGRFSWLQHTGHRRRCAGLSSSIHFTIPFSATA